MRKYLIALAVILSLGNPVPAGAEVVGQTDDPLVVGGGARPIGMGRAFTAVADDADAAFINPAGIGGLKGPTAMMMMTNMLMGEIYYAEFCGAIPATFGTLGLGLISTGVNQIPTDVDSSTVYTDYYDTLIIFNYSTALARFFGYGRNIYVGANYKIFNRGWTGGINRFASGQSIDLGIKYIVTPYLSFGLSRQNVLPVTMGGVLHWSTGAEEAIASLTKFGIAVKPLPLGGNVLFAYDIDFPAFSGRPVTMHFGTEWKTGQLLSLRGGLDQSLDAAAPERTSWNPTFGLSFDFARFRLDYAYHSYYNDPALANNYFSLSYQADPWMELKGEAAPAGESPRRR
ncbi:MAG: hypothetical protein WC529_08250 [Candidatus Margulisiibacteriota bacterium]